MAKNPNSRPRPAKREEPMNGAMKFFLAGCVAELYLLIIRRFYINGTGKHWVGLGRRGRCRNWRRAELPLAC